MRQLLSIFRPSSTPRSAWVHPARSARAFWTPAVIVLGATAAMLLCWPRGQRRFAGSRAMPEPSAAYVLLDGAKSYPFSPEKTFPLSGSSVASHFERLEDLERTPRRELPAPIYDAAVGRAAWQPMEWGLGTNPPPDLAAWPVDASLNSGLPPATNGLAISLSPGLQRCGFTFNTPFQVTTTTPATVCFHVEVDDAGRVTQLLAGSTENPKAARLVEQALNMGHAAHAGRGEIQVSWGR